MTPIYIQVDTVTMNQVRRLEEFTGRIVVLTSMKPKECVLDQEETLRDKFAAQAVVPSLGHFDKEAAVRYAYEVADAMLKERIK